jgi:hypothetical protein
MSSLIINLCLVCGEAIEIADKKFMLAYGGPPGIQKNIFIHRSCRNNVKSKAPFRTKSDKNE